MKIRLTRAARDHLRRGHRFYERQADSLGSYFLDSVMADIDSLLIHAGVHKVVFEFYHRKPCDRFPWSVYYRVEDGEVRVRAVLDDRRNPESIQKLLASLRNPSN